MRSSVTTLTSSAAVYFALLLLVAGCASQRQQIRLSDDERLNSFLEDVREAVETHAWEDLLEAADDEHHRLQVVEMGMSEPQYLAELLGLHMVDNDIGDGEAIEWEHLDGIETLRFDELDDRAPRAWVVRGYTVLADGRRLDVQADVVQRNGRYQLRGGVG